MKVGLLLYTTYNEHIKKKIKKSVYYGGNSELNLQICNVSFPT